MKTNKIKLLPVAIILTLWAASWTFNLQKYLNFDFFQTHHKTIQLLIKNHFTLSVLVYCLVYIIIIALSFPAATFLSIIGGLFLGQMVATTAVALSATIGTCIFFVSVRNASENLLNEKKAKLIAKLQKGFQKNAFSYLFSLRLMPFFPSVIVSSAAAICRIPLRTFALGTFLGIIPSTYLIVSMGVSLGFVCEEKNLYKNIFLEPKLLICFTLLASISLIPTLYKFFKGEK